MREIKFRVWDSERKKILPIQRHSFKTGKSMPYGWNVEYVFDELMQYTGLKDKNGKEIYEGDIIKNNFAETIGSIMFADCGYWIKTINKDIFDNTIYHVLGQYDGEVLEIIGNIYENPELLEGVDND